MKLEFKNHKTLFFPFVFALLITQSVFSGEFVLIKKNDPIGSHGYVYSDTSGVCKTYENNLKQFKNEPFGMSCGRKINTELGLTRTEWVKLDILEHEELVRDIFRAEHWEESLPKEKSLWVEYLKNRIKKDSPELEMTGLDVDGDGQPENILRYRFSLRQQCNPEGMVKNSPHGFKLMAMADSSLKNVIKTFPTRDDIFQYKGSSYSDLLFGQSL